MKKSIRKEKLSRKIPAPENKLLRSSRLENKRDQKSVSPGPDIARSNRSPEHSDTG